MMKPVPQITPLTRPYWDAAASGELHVQSCAQCSRVFLFARPWCPFCWAPEPKWKKVSGRGEVIACTIVTQAPYESYAQDGPYALAIIKLEEGPQLMTNIVNCPLEKVKVGIKVQAVFERRGDIVIPQFTPR